MQKRRTEDDRLTALMTAKQVVASEIAPQIEKKFSFAGYLFDLFQSDEQLLSRIVAAVEAHNKLASVLQSNVARDEIAFFKTFIEFRERELEEQKRRYSANAPYAVVFSLVAIMFALRFVGATAPISIIAAVVFFIIAFTLYLFGMFLVHKAKYINLEIKSICEMALDKRKVNSIDF